MTRFLLFDHLEKPKGELNDIVSARMTENAGEVPTLEMTLLGHTTAVKGDRIIFLDSNASLREFIITSPKEERSTSEATTSLVCRGSLGELESKVFSMLTMQNTTATLVLKNLLGATRWSVGTVESTAKKNVQWMYTNTLDSLLSLASQFSQRIETELTSEDGFKITKRVVNLKREDAANDPIKHRFEYGANLASVSRTVDASNIVTRLFPYGKKQGDSDTSPRVSIESVNDGSLFLENTDATEKYGIWDGTTVQPLDGIKLWDNIEDPAQLKTFAQLELNSRSKPQETFKASVAALGFGTCRLYDRVRIIDTTFSTPLALDGQIIKIETNFLAPSETQITLGNLIPTA